MNSVHRWLREGVLAGEQLTPGAPWRIVLSAEDATLNGLANLDMFAKTAVLGLKSALTALKPALLACDLALSSPIQ